MDCRLGCGACCIAPSISSAIPGMPNGKPAGERCIQLNDDNLCQLFGKPDRPKVCHEFKPCPVVCGSSNQQALINIAVLERST
ncbi:YkgJ family cysteine cluster protein [Vibrio sp. JPW-9-11-11]|uniref:YkgJ family cysteine cluster protein n=1 Tax=Vibrio sp. JPW-9-11-11 TaxID=1416532 RepID=UPI001594BE6C|nr:YkgJ family cysteine cluster protein [Vibrio sp. JPW-9-11-11]NVD06219.1 YkgJ family cysteine cluster protein [Vibrio sp. JPW-9-11-11]